MLWGETSLGSPGKKSRKTTRRVEPARVPRSRFALDADRLVEVMTTEVSGFAVSKEQIQSWVAWLPSNAEGALPSSHLLTEQPEDQGADSVSPWEVPALALTTEQAVAVLVSSIDRTTWGPGVVVGKSLAYWTTVLRFAGALVARQRYLPGVVEEGDGLTFRARWKPVLTGAERLGVEQLARSMPHACRALKRDANDPPRAAPSFSLAEVLTMLVDHMVRAASPRSGKSPARFASPRYRVSACHESAA